MQLSQEDKDFLIKTLDEDLKQVQFIVEIYYKLNNENLKCLESLEQLKEIVKKIKEELSKL